MESPAGEKPKVDTGELRRLEDKLVQARDELKSVKKNRDKNSKQGNQEARSRFDKLTVETENGKTQEFGIGAYPSVGRGGKGTKPGARTNFIRVVPPPIVPVNWDEIG